MVVTDTGKPKSSMNMRKRLKFISRRGTALTKIKNIEEFSHMLELSLTKQSLDNQLILSIFHKKTQRCCKYWGFQNIWNHYETNSASIICGLYNKFDVIENILTFDCGGSNFDMSILFISDQIFKGTAQLEISISLLWLRKHFKNTS